MIERDDRQRALVAALGQGDSIYVHGPAGRGKTHIVDAHLRHTAQAPLRVHFHAFLATLHRAVFARQTAIREQRLAAGSTNEDPANGPPDPVEAALADVIGEARVLAFDEFHLHDPGDARLLTRLLEFVLAHGIRLIATSNYPPGLLLPDPVWHHIALPGIRMIEHQMTVFHLDGGRDYRQPGTTGFGSGIWTRSRPQLPPRGTAESGARVDVGERTFTVTATAGDEIWLTFSELCEQATSTIEFLAWAQRFRRWNILDIPRFDTVPPGAQQRFLTAVDILVDADIATTFTSLVRRDDFIASAGARPDAPRLASRLRMLHES
ncbi:AFG1/ZapE family ATPase [Microbacterium amylolyticum]|uniref:Cell division protein ZapE n=1 Tax=Microbacterium amylolyticum TaxID=936337 RepID=A0ABS4ZGW0_9MICO|nr:AFG1/ZapE family ATPase [Microbacterium amylolyticum]MBP2436442.1 cell division protein ZapE [Microbacterium amylolyticum]